MGVLVNVRGHERRGAHANASEGGAEQQDRHDTTRPTRFDHDDDDDVTQPPGFLTFLMLANY